MHLQDTALLLWLLAGTAGIAYALLRRRILSSRHGEGIIGAFLLFPFAATALLLATGSNRVPVQLAAVSVDLVLLVEGKVALPLSPEL